MPAVRTGLPGLMLAILAAPASGERLVDLVRPIVGTAREDQTIAPGISASSLYVPSATLDGRPHERPWIAHADVARGGTLKLRMGPRPNRRWGARPENALPSLSATRR